jgi:gamma-glutamyltranspeptidase
MAAPQYHFQDQPDSLIVENVAWGDTAVGLMAPLGHGVKKSPWGRLVSMQSIHREAGKLRGVSEPRGFGLARGY